MAWIQIAPWRIIKGTGRTVAVASSSNTADTITCGSQTYALQLSLAVQTTAMGATISFNTAATATGDLMLKSTDPPLLIAAAPGTIVNVWGLGATGTLFITEMTH